MDFNYLSTILFLPAAGALVIALTKNKDEIMKGIIIGGVVGGILYYLYTLPWWVKFLGGLGLAGGLVLFVYFGGAGLVLYLILEKRKR